MTLSRTPRQDAITAIRLRANGAKLLADEYESFGDRAAAEYVREVVIELDRAAALLSEAGPWEVCDE